MRANSERKNEKWAQWEEKNITNELSEKKRYKFVEYKI